MFAGISASAAAIHHRSAARIAVAISPHATVWATYATVATARISLRVKRANVRTPTVGWVRKPVEGRRPGEKKERQVHSLHPILLFHSLHAVSRSSPHERPHVADAVDELQRSEPEALRVY